MNRFQEPAGLNTGRATTSLADKRQPDLLQLHRVGCDLGGIRVVDGVSFSLAQGDLGCLLGPSGCGKTTLLRAIAGFQPLAAGAISRRGVVVSNPHARRAPEQRGTGFVFQNLALFPHLTVAGNIAFGLSALTCPQRTARVAETAALCGLTGLEMRYPDQLSGGQRQRVALARALAPRPDLLLLDEPFSNLDAQLRASLCEEVRALLKRLGIAALWVTHEQSEALAFADVIGVMRAGRIEQWATALELYRQPATPFVAGFVGEGQLLPARVQADGSLDSAVGRFCGRLPANTQPGDNVRILLRPEDFFIAEAGQGFLTSVVSASFRGAEARVTLQLNDGNQVRARSPCQYRFAIGENVWVRAEPAHPVTVYPLT